MAMVFEEEIGDVIQASEAVVSAADCALITANSEEEKKSGVDEELQALAVEVGWNMFEKIGKVGEGANGTVYKVKALMNTVFSSEIEGRIELNNPELIKKYGSSQQKLGINMHSSVEKSNRTRQILKDQAYVIKEIDVSVLDEKAAFEAMQEI